MLQFGQFNRIKLVLLDIIFGYKGNHRKLNDIALLPADSYQINSFYFLVFVYYLNVLSVNF